MRRLLTAAVAVPLLLLIILEAPAWAFLALALACALLAYWELSNLTKGLGTALPHTGYPATALLMLSFVTERLAFLDASLLAILIVGCGIVLTETPGKTSAVKAIGTVFATFYIGALLGSLVALRMLGPEPAGRHWVVFLLAIVMLGDAAAFYVGKSVGRHPLAPRLSPKKTIEGLAGNVLGSVLAAVALQRLGFVELSALGAVAVGVGLALLGVCGDLFESFLKRSAGVKDASALIPGHGGMLDRLDSILFAAPGLLLSLRLVAS